MKDRPDDIADTTWNTDGSGVVADGQWYFHLITADNAGNWTPLKAMVGPIKIDATPPTSHAGKGEHEVIQSSVYFFPVRISGADNASGVKSITVRYQDVTTKGPWTQWKSDAQPDGE